MSVMLVMCVVVMLLTNDACRIKKGLVWEEGERRGFYGKKFEGWHGHARRKAR